MHFAKSHQLVDILIMHILIHSFGVDQCQSDQLCLGLWLELCVCQVAGKTTDHEIA